MISCHLRGERLVRIEPQALLQASGAGAASPAAQILQRHCSTAAYTQGPRALQLIEQIVALLDGLPLLLEIAGQALLSMSPNELHARLKRDPLMLMRDPLALKRDPHAPGHEAASGSELPGAGLAQRVMAWLQPASAQMRDMLSLLGQCRSALTREDIEVLLDNPGSALVSTWIEQAVRHQWLLRRAAGPAATGASVALSAVSAVSEFRVPRIVTAALRLLGDNAGLACSRTRRENWLARGHLAVRIDPAALGVGTAADTAASHWFDAHVQDIDDAVVACLEAGRLDAAARICKAHAGHWSLEQHAARLKVWLEGLGDTMGTLGGGTAAALLVARARLRVHLGDMHLACGDASRALSRVDGEQDADVLQHALHLLQRYGLANGNRQPGRPSSWLQRGVDDGENLLRMTELAVRDGQLPHALLLCTQALDAFESLGLAPAIVRAHQCRAKIAYALGKTDLSLHCLSEAERAAERYGNGREAQRARLMRADVLLSRMHFTGAIDLASALMSRPGEQSDPALALRGLGTVAWAYYGLGAYRLAQALCNDMRGQMNQTRGVAARLNVQILSALIEARCQRPEEALQSACCALDLLMTKRPLSDLQGDLVNVAELAICLDRPDLARPMLRALHEFSARPEHQLRPWVDARMDLLAGKDWAATPQPPCAEPMPSQFDVLTTLTTAAAAL